MDQFMHQFKILSSEKDKAAYRDMILEKRIKIILPSLMVEQGIEFWVVVGREFNESPLFKSLLPSCLPHSRGEMIFVFSNVGGNFQSMALMAEDSQLNAFYQGVCKPYEDKWMCLKRLISEFAPNAVGMNTSKVYPLVDDISLAWHQSFVENIGDFPVVSSSLLAMRWLETRIHEEIEIMKELCQLTHMIIHEVLTKTTIVPNKTSTTDIEWLLRQDIVDFGCTYWFGPDVAIQRRGEASPRLFNTVIETGDIIHVDIGLESMGLSSDIQQLAYVRRIGEKEAPKELRELFLKANAFQDVFSQSFKVGRTGNEILLETIKQTKDQPYTGKIYTHPIGYQGHGAGPSIGKYAIEGQVPVFGELVLNDNTCFSMELNISQNILCWEDQKTFIFLEEDVVFQNGELRFLDGRQEAFIYI